MDPIVKVIACTKFLGVPSDLIEDLVVAHAKGQDNGTDAERLVECAGRTCYDSYGAGRKSDAYHKHIMEVDHGSVTEHASLTFFLSNMSRGLTHELVRHRVGVAISQRSTRYVDESDSDWVLHPLIKAFNAEAKKNGGIEHHTTLETHIEGSISSAKDTYDYIVGTLEPWLIMRGTDKFTARKQARGAARGMLGNALLTEMVWTCNIRALKQILKQRANQHADAEIRVLANRLYEEALPFWPSYLGCYSKRNCPDGIGYELYVEDARDAEIHKLKEEVARLRSTVAESDTVRLTKS